MAKTQLESSLFVGSLDGGCMLQVFMEWNLPRVPQLGSTVVTHLTAIQVWEVHNMSIQHVSVVKELPAHKLSSGGSLIILTCWMLDLCASHTYMTVSLPGYSKDDTGGQHRE